MSASSAYLLCLNPLAVRARRLQLGLSHAQVGARAHMPPTMVVRLESTKGDGAYGHNVKLNTVGRLAQALRVRPHALLQDNTHHDLDDH